MEKMFLSVIIPAYNEAKRLPKTLIAADHYLQSSAFAAILSKNGYEKNAYEIMVVDDGSSDNTEAVVRKFQEIIKNLVLNDNQENHGKGWVVRKGMREAKGAYRIFMDADNSTTLDQIEQLLGCMKGITYPVGDKKGVWSGKEEKQYDVAIGSRALRNSVIKTPQPFTRVLFGKLSNLLIQIVAVPSVWDTQCGFKLVTAEAAEAIFSQTCIDRWGFDIEMLAVARYLGLSIKEVPIIWENDPESKVTFKGYLGTFKELFRVRINLWRNIYHRVS